MPVELYHAGEEITQLVREFATDKMKKQFRLLKS